MVRNRLFEISGCLLTGKHPEMLYRQCIAVQAQPGDGTDAPGRDIGCLAVIFPGQHIGNMYLDHRDGDGGNGIGQGNTGMCITTGIEHNALRAFAAPVQVIDQLAFYITLVIIQGDIRELLPELRQESIERYIAVNSCFSCTEQVQIGAVDNGDRQHAGWKMMPCKIRNACSFARPKKHNSLSAWLNGFKAYLQLERSMSDHTVEAYLRDTGLLLRYLDDEHKGLRVEEVTLQVLQGFLLRIHELELAATTQARIMSGIKSFFRFLLLEDVIRKDPTELLDAPKLKRALPVVLSIQDIDAMIATIDHSKPEGQRNRALLETLYSCGLRVSELTGLLLSNFYPDVGFIRVVGKGNKERLVPIGAEAIKQIQLYKDHVRPFVPVKPSAVDIIFLNRRGSALSRVMVFNIIKEAAANAGLKVNVHPHTFRHSFATHLVEAGADLRAVQEMLGHKSITTTEIYTHLDRSYLRSTLEKFHPRY